MARLRPRSFLPLAYTLAILAILAVGVASSSWSDTLQAKLTVKLGYMDVGFNENSVSKSLPQGNSLDCNFGMYATEGVDYNLNEVLRCQSALGSIGLKPGDTASVTVNIENSGTVDVMLDKVTLDKFAVSWDIGSVYAPIVPPLEASIVYGGVEILRIDVGKIPLHQLPSGQVITSGPCVIYVNNRMLEFSVTQPLEPGSTVTLVYANGRLVCTVTPPQQPLTQDQLLVKASTEKPVTVLLSVDPNGTGTSSLDEGEGSTVYFSVTLGFVNG